MPWRTVHLDGEAWSVAPAAERRASTARWALVLSFRRTAPPADGVPRRAVWVAYPLESSSQAALFQQAEHLSEDALRTALAERLGATGGG